MQKKKLIILAAVTGGSQQDRDGAKVPCTPADIAETMLFLAAGGAMITGQTIAVDGGMSW